MQSAGYGPPVEKTRGVCPVRQGGPADWCPRPATSRAQKGFYGTPKLAHVRDYSRDGALAALEASLRRLDTDRIDTGKLVVKGVQSLDDARRLGAAGVDGGLVNLFTPVTPEAKAEYGL